MLCEKRKSSTDKHLYLAPMMKRTDRHFRYLARLISPNLHLFTEMIPVEKILYGDREKTLRYSEMEKPVAIQLGGSKPDLLARAAALSALWGYDEINLNCGCPSKQVLKGNFGIYMMKKPELATACVKAIRAATPSSVPISVKIRLGVDNLYSYDYLSDFVGKIIESGSEIIHVHARRAILRLNPKSNRKIPPINYEWVYKLKGEYKDNQIILNGEINKIDLATKHLAQLDGVMIGRHAYAQPLELNNFDRAIFTTPMASKRLLANIIEDYLQYADKELTKGSPPKPIFQHLCNLFHGRPLAKTWRRLLTDQFIKGTVKASKLIEIISELKTVDLEDMQLRNSH